MCLFVIFSSHLCNGTGIKAIYAQKMIQKMCFDTHVSMAPVPYLLKQLIFFQALIGFRKQIKRKQNQVARFLSLYWISNSDLELMELHPWAIPEHSELWLPHVASCLELSIWLSLPLTVRWKVSKGSLCYLLSLAVGHYIAVFWINLREISQIQKDLHLWCICKTIHRETTCFVKYYGVSKCYCFGNRFSRSRLGQLAQPKGIKTDERRIEVGGNGKALNYGNYTSHFWKC